MSNTPPPDTPARGAVGVRCQSQRDDRSIAYFVSGSGPVVVLMASAGREVSDFNELVAVLTNEGYQTIAIEAPGIGGTTLPSNDMSLRDLAGDIEAVLDDQSVNQPVVVLGHAFGNRVVRAFAHKNPARVRAAVLVAAGGQRPVPAEADKALKAAFNPSIPSHERVEFIRAAFFAGDNPIPDYWKVGWYRDTATLQGKASPLMGDEPWQSAGGVPMLIVQADQDAIAPKEDTADVLARELEGRIDVIVIENAGHALLPEQPAAIADAIVSYLDGLPHR